MPMTRIRNSFGVVAFSILSSGLCSPLLAADTPALNEKLKAEREIPEQMRHRERAVTANDHRSRTQLLPRASRVRSPAGTRGGAARESEDPAQSRPPASIERKDRVMTPATQQSQAAEQLVTQKQNKQSRTPSQSDK